MDRINVIIANKDYEKYITDAILSCKNQTIPVIYTVIDDNSAIKPKISNYFLQEEENDLYESWRDFDGNRFILLKQTFGPSMARNIGIAKTINEYDYFMILDADDIMLSNKCQRLLETIKEDPDNIGVAYADYYHLDENGLLKMEFKRPYSRERLERECIVHSGSLISKKALILSNENSNFYDPSLRVAEDYDLWLRISEKMIIKHIPEFLSVVRIHKKNSSFSVNNGTWNQCLNYLHQKRIKRTSR